MFLQFVVLLLTFYQGCTQAICPKEKFDIVEKDCLPVVNQPLSYKTQIIGGEDANISEWPYIVSLQLPVDSQKGPGCYSHFCSGSLISPNLVLSAAHCIDALVRGTQGVPKFGVFVAQAPPCRHLGNGIGDIGFRSKVEYVEILPTWSRSSASGDIAILILNQSLPGPYVNLQKDYYDPVLAEPISIAGYGAVTPQEHANKRAYNMRYLQEATLYYQSDPLCKFHLDRFDRLLIRKIQKQQQSSSDQIIVSKSSEKFDIQSMICAFNMRMDTCKGDSGGPAVMKGGTPDEDVLLGVVSWGPGNQCSSVEMGQAPGIFARVDSFIDWIESIIVKHSTDVFTDEDGIEELDPFASTDDVVWTVDIP